MIALTRCPICASDQIDAKVLSERGRGVDSVFTIDECRTCKVRFVNPQPDDDFLRWFANLYMPENMATARKRERGYAPVFETVRRILARSLPHDASVLDVGAGYGGFLEVLRRRTTWRLQGIELSQQAVRHAAERLGDGVVSSETLADLVARKDRFDAVAMLNVIEHVRDPHGVVRQCSSLLAPGGVLLLRWPEFRFVSRVKRFLTGRELDFPAPEHLFDFNAGAIRILLEANGFEVRDTVVCNRRASGSPSPLGRAAFLCLYVLSYGVQYASAGRLVAPFGSKVTIARRRF